MREDRFSALARRFEQSVSFTVLDQERRIENLAKQVLVLAAALGKREERQIGKTILRVDFQKRIKVNDMLKREIRHLSQNVVRLSRKNILDKERDLQSLIDLIKASDPENILKKGFTLTLDQYDRVIKTLQEFNKTIDTRLRFHDGIVKIKKEEEK